MKKATEQNLIDASDALEAIIKELSKTSLEDKVDIAARVKAISKNAEIIDKDVKEGIKVKLRDKPGTVLGQVFKAVLKLIPTERLDQKSLKEERPDIHSDYLRKDEDKRITFEAR